MDSERTLVIERVCRDTALRDDLIAFVENFSWLEVKPHTLQLLRDWAFTDWETPFAAKMDGRIVGMATIMKTDYYPLPQITPWISTIFVSEAYRGHRISQRIIDFANQYAKELGFEKTYIPTPHVGLYEKYGYRYAGDIVNYAHGVNRLYVRENR